MLAFDRDTIYGFRRNAEHFSSLTVGSWMEYHLFAMKKTPELGQFNIQELPPMSRKQRVSNPEELWSSALPVLVRAMVLTPDTLFLAGPPDILDEEQLNFHRNDPELQAKAAEQADAWQGSKGGVLMAVATGDGAKLAEYKLDDLPTFDGMAAAKGKLFASLENGGIVCFKD